MKLVMRADDFGYTKVFNAGTIKAIEEGLITTVDIMLDTIGTIDALETIKNYPWISVGWHGGHCWGKPVADPRLVSSLLNKEGRFKYWNNATLKNDVIYEEALIECRAQINRCIQILGKAPICTSFGQDNIYERARKQVCIEFGIHFDYMEKKDRVTKITSYPLDKYRKLDIYMPTQHDSVYLDLYADSPSERLKYNPVKYFIEDPDNLKNHKVSITAWHPGYLDEYIFNEFPKNHFHTARVVDISSMCSPVLKKWVETKKVELVNMNDVLLGVNEYQNHLKANDSTLYVGVI